MKVKIKGPKGFDPRNPWRGGINVLIIDRGPEEIIITAKRAKRAKTKKSEAPVVPAMGPIRKRKAA